MFLNIFMKQNLHIKALSSEEIIVTYFDILFDTGGVFFSSFITTTREWTNLVNGLIIAKALMTSNLIA